MIDRSKKNISISISIYCLESERVLKRIYDGEYIEVGIYTGCEWADGGLVKIFLTVPCVFYAHAHTGFLVRTTLYATSRRDEGQVFILHPSEPWPLTGWPTLGAAYRVRRYTPKNKSAVGVTFTLHAIRILCIPINKCVCRGGGVNVYIIFI